MSAPDTPEGFWQLESTENPEPISPSAESFFLAAMTAAMRHLCAEAGLLLEGAEWRSIGRWVDFLAIPFLGDEQAMGNGSPAASTPSMTTWPDGTWNAGTPSGGPGSNGGLANSGTSTANADDAQLDAHLQDVIGFLFAATDVHILLHGSNALMLGELAFACRDLLKWDEQQVFDLVKWVVGPCSLNRRKGWPSWPSWPGPVRRSGRCSTTRTPPPPGSTTSTPSSPWPSTAMLPKSGRPGGPLRGDRPDHRRVPRAAPPARALPGRRQLRPRRRRRPGPSPAGRGPRRGPGDPRRAVAGGARAVRATAGPGRAVLPRPGGQRGVDRQRPAGPGPPGAARSRCAPRRLRRRRRALRRVLPPPRRGVQGPTGRRRHARHRDRPAGGAHLGHRPSRSGQLRHTSARTRLHRPPSGSPPDP